MNIGIDVDGTLIDIGRFMLEEGEAYFHRAASDPAAGDIEVMFGCAHKERNAFWKDHLLDYCVKSPIIDGAAETIRQLHDDGHKIFIITSRVFSTKRGPVGALFRGMLTGWLRRNGVVYDDIVFCLDSGAAKAAQCRRLAVDVMIDDKPENLLTIAEKRAVVVYPMPWNAALTDQGFVRAENWADIPAALAAALENRE